MDPSAHLLDLLTRAAAGSPPPADGVTEVLPPVAGRAQGVLAFTAHFVVVADVGAAWVRSRVPEGDLLAPMAPGFLAALGQRLGRQADALDAVLALRGTGAGPGTLVPGGDEHPRVRRSRRLRLDVAGWTDADGATTLALGRGLAGRWELSFEVDPAARGQGRARRALAEARGLVGADEWLFSQASPGNVASMRALLAAGFVPVGGEQLFYPSSAA